MRQFSILLMAGILLTGFGIMEAKNKITVESMPPVVVKTCPLAGMIDVDPSLKEIRVTFSKEMMTDDMWSWVMLSEESFPEITGKAKFLEDKRTCVAPVALERGKTYAIWFNSERHRAFRDTQNHPAVPYLLVFRTSD